MKILVGVLAMVAIFAVLIAVTVCSVLARIGEVIVDFARRR